MAEYIYREQTCKTCFHNAACLNILKKSFPTIEEERIEETAKRKNYCRFFKHTADVAEVRHGKWIDKETCYVCSLCGRVERVKEPYCHCGAKMDGKEQKE